MCGIAGIFRLTSGPKPEDVEAVFRMMDAQVHRGPDDWGILVPDSLPIDGGLTALLRDRGRERLRTYPDMGR